MKTFVVPPAEELPDGFMFGTVESPGCAVGLLGQHFGVNAYPYDLLAKEMGCTTKDLHELSRQYSWRLHKTAQQQREVFINWLRKHFPNNEVKP